MYATTESLATTPAAQGGRSRWLALYVLCAGMLMIVLDVTVVNVALPAIQDDLGFTSSSLAWVVNAYLIAFGGLLLLAGRLGDLLGRRNIFVSGLVVFTAASVLCGLAESQEVLVAARFVQGVGGALTSAVILGMIVTLFPEPREQAKAIGVYAFVASAGGSIGLLAGGVLTQAINWHWIFFVNLPIGVVTAVLAVKLIEKDKGLGMGRGTDVPGAVLITAALMVGVFTIVKPAAELGWTAPRTIALGLLTLTLLACFIVREATAANPLVPLRIFKSRNLTGANLIQALSASGMFGIFFLGSLYLQRVLGYNALEIGLAFLPTTVVMGLLSVRYSEKLVMRFGPRRPMIAGLVLIVVGLALFTQAPVNGNYFIHVLPVLALLGLGGGICFPALMGLSMADVKPEDAGLASGLIGTMGEVGAALGLAVLATLSATRTESLAAAGKPALDALTSGFHLSFAIAGVIVAAAVVIACTLMRPARPAADAAAASQTEVEELAAA
ncbi:EmrB/QacA subfamily drug resistance transporter [Kribbella voronezhensis]|uniref:EmrB/QacA subfamily drug resistance transporter n=1 Tax=Kribbella voronezhensis TaxID=2512212 RepID=A0A4R7TBN2_9ACTN|nr:DHA2 family efflux MFS transporter permease subunit [Kribbella voronezhensis]TDU89482.1 EmrB/QacA subfamily drug resistance transporter [Kribbella voronezhensis]